MELISNVPLLGPIIDELLDTKHAQVMYFFGFRTMRVWFCSSFYPTRIVKDKVWVTRVCYLIVDHAHPTLESLLAGRMKEAPIDS